MTSGITAVALSPELGSALARCREPGANAQTTLPPSCYVDDEALQAEQAALFRRGWVGVGRADRWSKQGDYSALLVGDVPIVVVRSDDGLKAFANTCSHRAAQIMTGDGTCARMRCPFHFWTYDLDGRLLAAPSMGQTTSFDRNDHGLTEFRCEERHGFAFVSLDAAAPSIDAWLDDFGEVHSPWPLDSLVTARRREFTVACNWKAFAEVFNEYYHLPYVHPKSIDDTYNEPDPPEQVRGAFATHFGTTEGTGGVLDEDRGQELPTIPGLIGRPATGVRYTWIFPNTIVAFGSDALWMYEVYPDGPHRTRCAQVVCFPPSTIERDDFEAKSSIYYERFDVALDEDIPMLEQQHAGFRSPYARQGKFSYLEPSVARFASWYAERLLGVGAVVVG